MPLTTFQKPEKAAFKLVQEIFLKRLNVSLRVGEFFNFSIWKGRKQSPKSESSSSDLGCHLPIYLGQVHEIPGVQFHEEDFPSNFTVDILSQTF